MNLWNMKKVRIPADSNYVEVALIGDTHIGQESWNERELEKYLSWILDADNRYMIGMGDYMELAMSKVGPAMALMSQKLSVSEQEDKFLEMFNPVSHRIITLLSGNHGQRPGKVSQIRYIRGMERQLLTRPMIENMGYDGWIVVEVGTETYYIYLHHGSGISKYPQHQLRRLIYDNSFGNIADIVACGHIHQQFVHPFPVMVRKGRGVSLKDCWGIRTGHCLNNPSYAREMNLMPSAMGFPIIRLWGNRHKIDAALTLERIHWVNFDIAGRDIF